MRKWLDNAAVYSLLASFAFAAFITFTCGEGRGSPAALLSSSSLAQQRAHCSQICVVFHGRCCASISLQDSNRTAEPCASDLHVDRHQVY